MLNYQLMKHTNQLISYYTKEIILYNYTCILETSSINTTCQQLVKRLARVCSFLFNNQYLITGPVFSSRPFETCQLFSFVDIFLVFGQQEGRTSFWGLSNINLSKMKMHYNRFWNKLCSYLLC